MPMLAMTGAAVKDMYEKREKDEFTIYLTLDQEGPCQNGAWPSTWDTFLEQLQVPDILGGLGRSTTKSNLSPGCRFKCSRIVLGIVVWPFTVKCEDGMGEIPFVYCYPYIMVRIYEELVNDKTIGLAFGLVLGVRKISK